MDIDITTYYPTNNYNRNGTDCILCNIRNRLIKKTPEETIRQAFVNFLIYEKGIPKDKIAIEFPLTRISKGDKKRADIIVYGDNDNSKIVLVVECKKGNWTLTDRDKKQAQYYSSVLNANCVVITNGSYHVTLKKFDGIDKQINVIPNYSNLLKLNSLKKYIVEDEPYERHDIEQIYSGEAAKFFLEWGHIGIDTDKQLLPFVSNIVDLLFDKESSFENLSFNGITIIKDLGTVIDSFSNAAGGHWAGEYKKFLIQDKNGNHQTIGIGIFGSIQGFSTLVVSVDDYEKSHNSLQLNIDKYVKKINQQYFINHSGKLTSGHKGSIKFETVKSYVKKHAPHLIVNGDTIQLGIFPDKQLYRHTDKHSQDLIKNLIEYAILRDEIRRGSS